MRGLERKKGRGFLAEEGTKKERRKKCHLVEYNLRGFVNARSEFGSSDSGKFISSLAVCCWIANRKSKFNGRGNPIRSRNAPRRGNGMRAERLLRIFLPPQEVRFVRTRAVVAGDPGNSGRDDLKLYPEPFSRELSSVVSSRPSFFPFSCSTTFSSLSLSLSLSSTSGCFSRSDIKTYPQNIRAHKRT